MIRRPPSAIGTAANSRVSAPRCSAPATSAAPAKANAHAVSYWMRSSPNGMVGALLACQPVMTWMQNATTATPVAANSTPVMKLARETSNRIACGVAQPPCDDRVMVPNGNPDDRRR